MGEKWRLGDSNSRHPACKAGALPAELSPQVVRWPGRGRTFNGAINSRGLCQLSYGPMCFDLRTPPRIRTGNLPALNGTPLLPVGPEGRGPAGVGDRSGWQTLRRPAKSGAARDRAGILTRIELRSTGVVPLEDPPARGGTPFWHRLTRSLVCRSLVGAAVAPPLRMMPGTPRGGLLVPGRLRR